jgi:Phosphotransferase enzyme family
MSDASTLAPWQQAGWLEEATAWADAGLAEVGLSRSGPMIPRERAWSIVLELPTAAGPIYLKESGGALANDAGITELLAPLGPRVMLTPLAVDAARRRMLLPHGGERLRDRFERDPDPAHWERLLPAYAELQRAAAPHTRELLAAGALDGRLGRQAQLLTTLLEDPVLHEPSSEEPLRTAELEGLRGLVPLVRQRAGELAEVGIGPSIQHDDFHDGNILVSDDGAYRFIDWGDAYVGHPFGSLLITVRNAARQFGWSEDGPEARRLRDAYLEPWGGSAPRGALLHAVDLARWLAAIGRALAWRAVWQTESEAERPDAVAGVIDWLRTLAAGAP